MNALVSIKDGEPRASSLDVAAAFEKAHKDVLRAIDKLIELEPQLTGRNFAPSQVQSPGARGRMVRSFDMDQDGFSLLAMGFTGHSALQWKLKFLAAFRHMREALERSMYANDDAPELPQAQRDGVNTKLRQVELMLKMCGTAPALALWKELGLTMTEAVDCQIRANLPWIKRREQSALPPPEAAEPGPLWQWTSECDVKPNLAVATPMIHLWQEYAAWCARRGYGFSEPPAFAKGLRIAFGKEDRRGIFNVEVGKTSIGTGPGSS